jgi:hypothetical protein
VSGSERYLIRRPKGNALFLAPLPPQQIPAAKDGKQQTDSAKQRNQRKHAPHYGVGHSMGSFAVPRFSIHE